MWSWTPWSSGQGRGEEKEETKKQQNMAERQRLPRGAEYYQRSKTKELPPKASKTAAMDKGKVSKHDSSQGKDGLDESYTALDQALKDNQELQRKQAVSLKRIAELEKRDKKLRAIVAKKEAEVARLHSELVASSGPVSTLSTDSERYHTPYSSLPENESERRGLVQVGAPDSDVLLRLQRDMYIKDDTIKSLEGEVNLLKKRLKYAEQLEEQNFRLTTEESKHEEEKWTLRREVELLKRRASVSRPLTRSYAHEQRLQELAQRYEQQYHEELEENSRLREKISQLEKEIQGQEEVTTHIDEVDDPDLNAELRRKDQRVHTLQAQVEGLQQHSKGQSKNILHLKQELEALKLAGEEIDASWGEMVDQLEEENRKLSQDVGALYRDKKFLEKSMETIKARNEELELLSQRLQVSKHDSSQEKDWLDESCTALDQALKDNQELQRRQSEALKRVAELEKRNKELRVNLAKKEAEVTHSRHELTTSSGPTSTLSTDSERYHTPNSSPSENESEHRALVEVGATDSDILLRLQKDNDSKDDTIKSLEEEVNLLKKRLKYAEQLEEQNLRLTTEESKHEEEKRILRREVESLKRKASVSRPLTRSYAHEQRLQELAQRYEQQYHEQLEENSRLQEKISQLEKEIQGQEEGSTHIDDLDDPDLNAELRKDQHVHTLQTQVEALQQHSKGQNMQIVQLKQELEALKLSGEEVDASWRELADQLEEDNTKLSQDVGALHRDRKFLEKSMETTKARNEVLEPLAQNLQSELEEMKQKEEWYRKQLENTTENSRKAYQKCQELEAEKRQLSEQMDKLSGFNDENVTLVNGLKALVRKLEQEKEALQNEVQIAKTEAQLYMEDFESERSDREVAHGKIADHQKKYAHDVGELKEQLAQIEEHLSHHQGRLAEVEQVNERREREMRDLLEEASKNQQEVQAKISQVKQYKKQVDSLKEQVAELTKHNEDLIQEMGKVFSEMEKLKTGKSKKKPSDTDEPSKLAELEGRNKELSKERDRLFRELDKTRKDLVKAKAKVDTEKPKKDAEKGKKDAKRKQSNKGATSPEPSETSKALEGTTAEEKQLRAQLLSENDEEAVALRLQLEAQKSEQDQLYHQLEQTEATVRQLEADLNFSRARVAELEREITKLEGGITEMKTALSKAEHDHQRIYQELSKLITEKEALQQATQAEQLKLRQLTQDKDRFIQNLQSEKDQLRQQLAALSWQIQKYAQHPQSQLPHESNFWEVPRSEITLNMQNFLGTGAWGFVVEGTFRGQKVAVKCLHDLIRQPEVIEVIRKEIGIMAQIRHPNLVLLIAAVIDAKRDPLIVTELLDTSLRKAYEDDLLKGSSKLSIFRDIASALNYLHLHQRGEIIHRDVSSANILLEAKPNNQWKAKLSDFGSAKLAIEAKTTGPGAPAYTAPEVQKEMGIRQTAKLDVYSYGIVLCEVIVGQFPMEGSLPSMMQVVRSRWPFMHSLVTSCIQEHPDNRPTMSYVLERFDKLRPQK